MPQNHSFCLSPNHPSVYPSLPPSLPPSLSLSLSFSPPSMMENGKRVGKKLQDSQKANENERRTTNRVNIQFRTIDKDLNSLRPDLMKLQERKKTLSRYISLSPSLPPSLSLKINNSSSIT